MKSSNQSRASAELYSELFPAPVLAATPLKHLNNCYDVLLGKETDLYVELVASARQESSIELSSDGGLIMLDLAQSMTLKTLLRMVADGVKYHVMANTIKGCVALFISQKSVSYARAIHEQAIGFDRSDLLHGRFARWRFGRFLRREYHDIFVHPEFERLVDTYLLSHEIGHFKLSQGLLTDELPERIADIYEYALKVVCYERDPEPIFRAKATYNGTIPMDEAGLEKIRRDLETRRSHYEANRGQVLEEVACDVVAYRRFLEIVLSEIRVENETPYQRVFQHFYIMLCMIDLHKAMNERVELSFGSSVENPERPGHIADINFRKNALVYAAAAMVVDDFHKENGRTDGEPPRILGDFQVMISTVKVSFDGYYHMPVTRAIIRVLKMVESATADWKKDRRREAYVRGSRLSFFDPGVLGDSSLFERTLGKAAAKEALKHLYSPD